MPAERNGLGDAPPLDRKRGHSSEHDEYPQFSAQALLTLHPYGSRAAAANRMECGGRAWHPRDDFNVGTCIAQQQNFPILCNNPLELKCERRCGRETESYEGRATAIKLLCETMIIVDGVSQIANMIGLLHRNGWRRDSTEIYSEGLLNYTSCSISIVVDRSSNGDAIGMAWAQMR